MTDRVLQTELLSYYEENLAAMPRTDYWEARAFLRDRFMTIDVCWVARKMFDIMIYNKEWFLSNCTPGTNYKYWGDLPTYESTIEGLEAAIKTRIETLKRILGR